MPFLVKVDDVTGEIRIIVPQGRFGQGVSVPVCYFTFNWDNFVFKATGKKEFTSSFDGCYTFLCKQKIIGNQQLGACNKPLLPQVQIHCKVCLIICTCK